MADILTRSKTVTLAQHARQTILAELAHFPLLMVNGMYDNDYNKDTSVEPLFKLANEPKKLIWTEGGHMYSRRKNIGQIS